MRFSGLEWYVYVLKMMKKAECLDILLKQYNISIIKMIMVLD